MMKKKQVRCVDCGAMFVPYKYDGEIEKESCMLCSEDRMLQNLEDRDRED